MAIHWKSKSSTILAFQIIVVQDHEASHDDWHQDWECFSLESLSEARCILTCHHGDLPTLQRNHLWGSSAPQYNHPCELPIHVRFPTTKENIPADRYSLHRHLLVTWVSLYFHHHDLEEEDSQAANLPRHHLPSAQAQTSLLGDWQLRRASYRLWRSSWGMRQPLRSSCHLGSCRQTPRVCRPPLPRHCNWRRPWHGPQSGQREAQVSGGFVTFLRGFSNTQ